MKKILTKFLKVFFCFSLIVLGAVACFWRSEKTPSFYAGAVTKPVTVNFYQEYEEESRRKLLYTHTFQAGEEVAYPADPEVAAAPEKKSNSSNYHWEFDGWIDENREKVELSSIDNDIDLFATYKQVYDVFTVEFYIKNSNFTRTRVDTLRFRFDDESREYTGKTPTKQSTIAYTYVHSGWEKEDGTSVELKDLDREDFQDEINPTITLYATFREVPINYNITYHYEGGTLDNPKNTYNYDDDTFTLPQPTPDVEDAEFIGWLGTDIPERSPQKTVTINPKDIGALKEREYTAVYSTTKYTVTFEIFDSEKNPGTVDHESISVTYGSQIQIKNDDPTITIDGQTVTASPSTENKAYTFTFDKFETSETEVKYDISILVRFKSTPKVYNINYNDNGGSVVYPNKDDYTIESGTVYLRETSLDRHTFIGWNETSEGWEIIDDTPIKSFVVSDEDDLRVRYYIAVYQENEYTVTFIVQNSEYGTISYNEQEGARIEITGVKEGTRISYDNTSFHLGEVTIIATPTAEDYEFYYTFSVTGWRVLNYYSEVTEDFEVLVVFTATAKEYFLSYSLGSVEVQHLDGTTLNPYSPISYGERFKIIYTVSEHHHLTKFTLNNFDLSQFVESNHGEIEIVFNEDYITDEYAIIELSEAIDTFTVTISASEEERGTVSHQQFENISYGTELSILADKTLLVGETPVTAQVKDSGLDYCNYVFEGWDTSGKSIVDGNLNIVARFGVEYIKFTVSFDEAHVVVMRKQGEELIAVESEEELDWGTQLVLTYTSTAHYHCSKFSVDEEDFIDTLNETGKVEITLMKDITIDVEEEINKYQITFGAGIDVKKQGGENVLSGNYVDALTTLEITYTLSKNFKITVLTISGEDYSDSENPILYTIIGDTQIVFEEEKDKIPITAAESEHGSFTLSAESMEWEGEVTITVTPEQYFKFKRAYYIIEGEQTEHEIEGLAFEMPNDKITVYVEFEREYYFIADAETGFAVLIDASRVSAEPSLVFEEVSLEFSELVSSKIKGSHIQIYIFKIMVGETEIKDIPISIILTIPESFGSGTIDLFKTVTIDENMDFEVQQFTRQDNEISFDMEEVLPLVLVERAENVPPTPPTKPTEENKTTNTSTVVIIVITSCVAVAAISSVIVLIIIKKRKKHKI